MYMYTYKFICTCTWFTYAHVYIQIENRFTYVHVYIQIENTSVNIVMCNCLTPVFTPVNSPGMASHGWLHKNQAVFVRLYFVHLCIRSISYAKELQSWLLKICNSLQHAESTATHCNTLKHTATYCSALQRTIILCTFMHTYMHIYVYVRRFMCDYGVATISGLLKILFCRI